MSWDSYIQSLTKNEWLDDAVIIGHTPGQESVWAAAPGGWLNGVTVRARTHTHTHTICACN